MKSNKTVNIIVNVLVAVVLAIVLLISILAIMSGDKGYVDLFGYTYVAVETDSMDGDREDSFAAGALLKVDILTNEEKLQLKPGDIITFYFEKDGQLVLNTHRIVALGTDGNNPTFQTQGDNELGVDRGSRTLDTVVGKCVGHTNGIGNVVLFFSSSLGFFLLVVIPSLAIVAYFAVNLYKTVKVAKVGTAEEQAAAKEAEIQRLLAEKEEAMRAKILAELNANNGSDANNQVDKDVDNNAGDSTDSKVDGSNK